MIAGGKSSRFGSDKALALLGRRPLIEHAADAIRDRVDALVICGRIHRGWASLPDLPRPGLGPLGGIAAALRHAMSISADRVLTIGCDMPDVSTDLIDALIDDAPAFCADAPVLGCWRATAADPLVARLERCLDDHGPPVRRWAIDTGARPVAMRRPRNINTPADLAAL